MNEAGEFEELMSDLGIELGSARGRKSSSQPVILGVHEMTAEDVVRLNAGRTENPGRATSIVKELRARHHTLASLLAQGVPEQQASLQTGYSSSRISILKSDPAFQSLMEFYEDQNRQANVEVQERMRGLLVETVEELQDRLDREPEAFETVELLKMAEIFADRTGNGKTSTVKVEHGVDASVLERLKAQHDAEQRGKIHNLSQMDAATEAQVRQASRGDFSEAEIVDAEGESLAAERRQPSATGIVLALRTVSDRETEYDPPE